MKVNDNRDVEMREDNSRDRIQACPTNPDFWLSIKTEQEQKSLKMYHQIANLAP